MSESKKKNKSTLPQHVAIIMDGNGRWAKKQGKLRTYGHEHGVEAVRKVVEAASELHIPYLTLFAFSTENWNRPKFEVNTLMKLLVKSVKAELPSFQKNNIRFRAIGNLSSMDPKTRRQLLEAMDETSDNTGLNLILALSYSAKWEITEACRQIAQKVQQQLLDPSHINEDIIGEHLSTQMIPDPELLIRTSGEYRISNFMLWQIAYAELYFTHKLWPDFDKQDFMDALTNYQQRERRFGMTSEQIF